MQSIRGRGEGRQAAHMTHALPRSRGVERGVEHCVRLIASGSLSSFAIAAYALTRVLVTGGTEAAGETTSAWLVLPRNSPPFTGTTFCSRMRALRRLRSSAAPAAASSSATPTTEMAMMAARERPLGGERGGGRAGGGAGGVEGGGGEGDGGDGGGGDGGGGSGGGGATASGTETSVNTTGGATVSTLTPTAPLAASAFEMLAGGSAVRLAAACWIIARLAAMAEAKSTSEAVVALSPKPPLPASSGVG